MLAGQTPFHAHNMEGWMYQHLQAAPEPIGFLRSNLAREYPALEAVVMRLLARDREQRFASAPALLEALAAAVAPKPSEPRRVTVVETPPPPRFTPRPEPEPVPPPEPEPEQEPAPEDDDEHELLRPSMLRKPILKFVIPLLVVAVCAGIVIMVMQSRTPADTPTITESGGADSQPVTITITDNTPNAVIHYTMDDGVVSESSPIYTQPLELTNRQSAHKIEAIATADGHKPSSEAFVLVLGSAGPNAPQLPGSLQNASPYDQAKYSYDHKQYSQARTLFAQSCNSGEMKACNYLGYLYAQGMGGPQSVKQAQNLYQRACDQGTLSSCASLGSLYQNAGNTDNARKYFQKACNGGLSAGCDLLHGLQ
jgi:outer membrane biosynthesis protein TonB